MASSPRVDRAQAGEGGVAVIGEFDGMHLGHVRLVGAALALAARRRSSCYALVVRGGDAESELMPIGERCYQLVSSGVQRVLAMEPLTNDVTEITAQIVETVGRDRLGVAVLACNGDHSNMRYPSLRSALRRSGIDVVEVPRVVDSDAGPISANLIRTRIAAGDVDAAERWLGRLHELRGIVEHGDHRGRTIGFPTANVRPSERDVVPAEGVYAAWVDVGNERWPAAVNVGRRPTFYSNSDVLVEAHLIGFSDDVYGAQLAVSFVRRLRAERRFGGIDDLVEQLRRDVVAAVSCLGDRDPCPR